MSGGFGQGARMRTRRQPGVRLFDAETLRIISSGQNPVKPD
jgi:hypothetical protein